MTEADLDAFADWERASWEQRADAYAASLGDLTRGSIGALLDAAAVAPGVQVLDVGCGPGFVALAAAERGAAVLAVDQSTPMVAHARAAGLDAVRAPADRLPVADGALDGVVAGYLLNHLARPEVAVAAFARVLRPGGRLALTIWDVPARSVAIGSIGDVVARDGAADGAAPVPTGPESTRFADEDEARTLLAAWSHVRIDRLHWTITVDPGAWFDAIADATPRTGAVLAGVPAATRARLRAAYVETARGRWAGPDGAVVLPAAAVLISATR